MLVLNVANAIGMPKINFEYRQRYRFYHCYRDQTTDSTNHHFKINRCRKTK